MSEEQLIIREGFFQGSRTRTLDADKNPTSDWGGWHFASANGSGYFSYLYSRKFVKDKIMEYPVYSTEGQPKRPPELQGRNPHQYGTIAYKEFNEKSGKWYEEVYRVWHDNRPIIGYRQTETRNIPGKQVISMEDAK